MYNLCHAYLRLAPAWRPEVLEACSHLYTIVGTGMSGKDAGSVNVSGDLHEVKENHHLWYSPTSD